MKLKTKYERHNFNCGENLVLLEISDLGSHDNRVFLTRDEKENRKDTNFHAKNLRKHIKTEKLRHDNPCKEKEK